MPGKPSDLRRRSTGSVMTPRSSAMTSSVAELALRRAEQRARPARGSSARRRASRAPAGTAQ